MTVGKQFSLSKHQSNLSLGKLNYSYCGGQWLLCLNTFKAKSLIIIIILWWTTGRVFLVELIVNPSLLVFLLYNEMTSSWSLLELARFLLFLSAEDSSDSLLLRGDDCWFRISSNLFSLESLFLFTSSSYSCCFASCLFLPETLSAKAFNFLWVSW